jgi:tetratricopeptide (TPR) repeat protein
VTNLSAKRRKKGDDAGARSRRADAGGRGADLSRGGRTASRMAAEVPFGLARWSLAAVLAATLAAHAILVRCEYLAWDDLTFLDRSPFGRHGLLKSLALILTGNAYPNQANYAVTQAFTLFDVLVFRRNPHLSHLLNLVLHLVNVFLVWRCVCLLLARSTPLAGRQILIAASTAALLFGIHPVNVEPVAWVSGRKVELAFLFSLVAFNLLLSPHGGRMRYVLAVASYVLAVLSNAAAFGLTLVFGAWWAIVSRAGFRKTLLLSLPFLALVVWAGTMRFEKHTPEQDVVKDKASWSAQWGDGFAALARETLDLAYPKDLVPVYPANKGPFWTLGSFVGVFFMAASLGLIVWGWARGDPLQRVLVFGLAWYWLALAPTFAHHHLQADRHMYSSAVGLFMVAGVLLSIAFERFRTLGARTALAAAYCAAILALGIVAVRQGARWRTQKTLFTYAVAAIKDNHMAHSSLGYALAEEKDFDGAILQYQAALDFFPEFAQAHYNLGNALAEKGRLDEAIEHLGLAVKYEPEDPKARNNLGSALNKAGQPDEAEARFRQAIDLDPDYAEAHQNLGIVLFGKGQTDPAIEELRRAIAIKPDYAEAYQNLGAALYQKGRIDDAVGCFEQALRLDPNLAGARQNLDTANRAGQRSRGQDAREPGVK